MYINIQLSNYPFSQYFTLFGLLKSDFNPYMWRWNGGNLPKLRFGRERVGSVEKVRTDRSCNVHSCHSQNFGKIGKKNKEINTLICFFLSADFLLVFSIGKTNSKPLDMVAQMMQFVLFGLLGHRTDQKNKTKQKKDRIAWKNRMKSWKHEE